MIDFRQRAKERAGKRWSRIDENERRRLIRSEKLRWLQAEFGPPVTEPSYGEWLKSQPKKVQDEALGPTRAKLWREGGLTIDKFISPTGLLTLEQLAETRPEAFTRAGLDPDDFDKDKP